MYMVTVSSLLSISSSQEPIPTYVSGSYLYISANRAGFADGAGRIYKYDLVNKSLTELKAISGYAMWEGTVVHDARKIVRFGELNDPGGVLRAGVAIIDLSNDSVTTAYHPNTGDCNELVGVAYDYRNKRFIVGERVYGGVTSGSSWPNGGGLWIIPYGGLTDYTQWSRVYEFPNNPEVTSVAVFKDTVYVGLFRRNVLAKVSKASTTDLTSWTDVESTTTTTARPYVDAEDNMIAYGLATDGNYVVRWSTDGSTWNSATVAPADTTQETLVNVKVVGKYIFVAIGKLGSWRTDLYMVDTSTGSVTALSTGMSGAAANKPFYYDGVQNLYMSTAYIVSGYIGTIYNISFDSKRVLALSAPASVSPGQTITLTATLTDGANPVPGAAIEFYVVDYLSIYSPVGTLIGTATTDSSGNASITYTVPSDATGKLVFAAIYKG
jgi:hypothetical protein